MGEVLDQGTSVVDTSGCLRYYWWGEFNLHDKKKKFRCNFC